MAKIPVTKKAELSLVNSVKLRKSLLKKTQFDFEKKLTHLLNPSMKFRAK